MDDLIKKLRAPAGAGMTGESALAMADAADEIERLRGLVRAFIDADIDAAGGSPEAWLRRHESWTALRTGAGYRQPGDEVREPKG